MSTAANKQKKAERQNEREIQKGIKLVGMVSGAMTITWLAVIIAIIIVASSHKTVVNKTNMLAGQDLTADISVKDLYGDVQALKNFSVEKAAKKSPSFNPCLKDDIRYMSNTKNILRSYEGFQEWGECLDQCRIHPECLTWSYVKPDSGIADQDMCHLKDNFGKPQEEKGVISGIRDCLVEDLLKNYDVEFDKQINVIADFREKDNISADYAEDYASHYIDYKTPIIEVPATPDPNTPDATVAPTPAAFSCPENDMYYFSNSMQKIGDTFVTCKTFMECSDACISTPECKYWTFFTPKYGSQSSGGRGGRGRGRGGSTPTTGKCYLLNSITERQVRTNVISAERKCFDNEIRAGFKHYAQYHANFIGYGCHVADCKLADATDTHVVKKTFFVNDCIRACYAYRYPVYELTFIGMDSECHCHYYNNSTGPIKYNFYGADKFKEEYLKYTLF